ncbi:sodium:solute symporter [Blastopirellula retiformator]|uniref:Sodium/glucose cotransporter n=1 Tax=Blastopirellula retiformator TaxID=2527970 RepID=A0A5C5VAJ3_9BACT|nr:sodium:solute symporter [Blastopirellula retiformator]TWT34665.1 Sodium/glucose cotransporter [Blastopirellula retiformator]
MDLTLRPLDVAAILVYLAAMFGIGIYFSRRNETTEEYFVGNRAFPGWVIGLSMLGTIVSSATFLALPAAAYVLDWRQLAVNLALPLIAVMAVLVFIPFFRRGKLTSAFEYLGMRFGMAPRIYGTLSFIVLQLIRMAQILFLVSIPVQFMTGLSIEVVVIGAGLFIAFYTIAGGIEAVVWTDVVQAIVLLGGGLLCFLYIAWELPGGMTQVLEVGVAEGKFSLGSFEWNLSERTFWTVAILGIINWLAIYSGDQNIVQRYVAAKSTYEARKATIIYSAIALPMWTMFFFIGTALYVYFQTYPEPALAGLETDQVFPYFILTRIPAGLAGLILAAVVAAAMSSLDSGINSISTVVVVDLLRPNLGDVYSDRFYLRTARVIAAVVTVLVISGGIAFSRMEKESMNDISLIVTSLFGGCLMGLFMMGFFTRRIDGVSATIAMCLAVVFNAYLGLGLLGWLPQAWTLGVHSYWVGALVNLFFAVTAYLLSFVVGSSRLDLTGLTVWTLGDRKESQDRAAPLTPSVD